MKNKLLLAFAFFLSVSVSWAQPSPDFSMIGYGAQEGNGNFYNAGGTTGGAGGKIVCPKDFSELKAYAESANPYIILIDKEITSGVPCNVDANGNIVSSGGTASTYGEVLLLGSNKTLLGIGNQAFLNRIGIVIQVKSNIIIRNIKFSMRNVPISKTNENKIVAWRNGAEVILSDPDCIGIQADKTSAKVDYGHHYWIDHCEFYNGDAPNKDRYDGLLDMKNNVQYITISWCHFHDHDKACLSGKGNSDNYPRTVTMHHNYFHNIQGSRLPLQRGGIYHYYNNMQEGCSDGYDLREGAIAYVEGCYFKDTKSPVMPGGGAATLVDLAFENCKRIPAEYAVDGVKYDELYTIPASDYRPPYQYTADAAADVPGIVPQYSGIGKITDEYDVNNAVDDLANAGTGNGSTDPVLGVGDPIMATPSGTGYDYYWFNADNETAVNAFIADGTITLVNPPSDVVDSQGNPVVSSFNPTKDPSNANYKTDKTGILALGKSGGAAIFKLPSCGYFKLYLFRTGTYSGDIYTSTDGEQWSASKMSLNSKAGVYELDITSVVAGEEQIFVKISNTSTGNLNIQGVQIFEAGEGVIEQPNKAPTVSITSPSNGASFVMGTNNNITIQATAADSDGSIDRVEFFVNGNSIGYSIAAPYSADYTFEAAGTYTLTAVASDDEDAMTTSAVVTVTVKEEGEEPDPEPTPGGNVVIEAGASLPQGYSTSFGNTAYTYNSDAIAAKLIAVEKGTYSITLPADVTVSKVVITGCMQANEDTKGSITLNGVSKALKGRKTMPYESLILENQSLTGTIEFTLDYKAGLRIELTTSSATSIEDSFTGKEVTEVEYISLNGVKLQSPVKGINIMRTMYDDGSVEVTKVFVK